MLHIDIDIFVNYNWVDTRWQQYSTHLHTDSTQNNTINNFGQKAFWDSNPKYSNPEQLLATAIEQSAPGEATCLSATREFPNALLQAKVHHRIHISSPLALILCQMNVFHSLTPHFLNIIPPILPNPPSFSYFTLFFLKTSMGISVLSLVFDIYFLVI